MIILLFHYCIEAPLKLLKRIELMNFGKAIELIMQIPDADASNIGYQCCL